MIVQKKDAIHNFFISIHSNVIQKQYSQAHVTTTSYTFFLNRDRSQDKEHLYTVESRYLEVHGTVAKFRVI
jgi:hypothetical protein